MTERTEARTALSLSRRALMVGVSAAAPILGAIDTAAARSQAGFVHGRFDISVFSDGHLTLGADILMPDADYDTRRVMLARLKGDGLSAPVAANVPLIRSGRDLVLIDTGAGVNFQRSTGRLAENLTAAGIDRRAITKVVFTHAHPDHAGGTMTADGQLLFPEAQYFIGRDEWDFWIDSAFESRRPAGLHAFARGARRDLMAVEDRLTRLLPGDEILPGMRIVPTPGHTPGHISVELDGPAPLLIVGDACTNDVIFFENPGWRFGFDVDPDLALSTRRALLDRAATDRLLLLGYHWSDPVPGTVERRNGAYRFVRA